MILDVFACSYMQSDPVKIAVEGVERFKEEKFDLIIVDTSGCHQQEAALFEEMLQVSEATVLFSNSIFVIDSLLLLLLLLFKITASTTIVIITIIVTTTIFFFFNYLFSFNLPETRPHCICYG